ncbi:MAG: Rieske 2Fe-2S domain-containing protein [Longimicrobiales bacterium]
MLTLEENELLTGVGPDTPAGQLLRRYWFPVAVSQDLAEQTTKFIRLLGEDLVLFKDLSGRVGLLADHCSHRGASLLYGRVEERGISCAYHGWLYDCEGNILETPPERNDAIMNSVKHTAYPVKQFIGMYWAYLGPAPAPAIPNLDVWVRKDGKRHVFVHPPMDCNWVQAQENSLDPTHALILHQDAAHRKARPVDSTRGFIDDMTGFEFPLTDYGIMKDEIFGNGYVEQHPVMFPNVLRVHNSTEIRVPIDRTRTRIFEVYFDLSEDGSINEDDELELPVEFGDPYKEPADKLHPFTRAKMNTVPQQDQAMWESQGLVSNRPAEHLSYSDRGVSLFRKLMFENIVKVQEGEDPLAVFRDPDHPMIETGLTRAVQHRKPLGINTPTYEVATGKLIAAGTHDNVNERWRKSSPQTR